MAKNVLENQHISGDTLHAHGNRKLLVREIPIPVDVKRQKCRLNALEPLQELLLQSVADRSSLGEVRTPQQAHKAPELGWAQSLQRSAHSLKVLLRPKRHLPGKHPVGLAGHLPRHRGPRQDQPRSLHPLRHEHRADKTPVRRPGLLHLRQVLLPPRVQAGERVVPERGQVQQHLPDTAGLKGHWGQVPLVQLELSHVHYGPEPLQGLVNQQLGPGDVRLPGTSRLQQCFQLIRREFHLRHRLPLRLHFLGQPRGEAGNGSEEGSRLQHRESTPKELRGVRVVRLPCGRRPGRRASHIQGCAGLAGASQRGRGGGHFAQQLPTGVPLQTGLIQKCSLKEAISQREIIHLPL
mmetsp:Transcript_94295/g.215723  ORF Transcript_94295/g.215723 Transcript_94295/m.215723 type:complete len:351 (-) Transcript_94295:643-1695(-)